MGFVSIDKTEVKFITFDNYEVLQHDTMQSGSNSLTYWKKTVTVRLSLKTSLMV
jgi:hypothetical protein